VNGPLKDPVALATALGALAPGPSVSEIDWVLRQASFDVCGDFRAGEQARFASLLEACGARCFATGPGEPPSVALRFVDRLAPAKAAACVGIGGVAYATEVPLVPLAAGATLIVLGVRAFRWTPAEVRLSGERVTGLLGAVDPTLFDEMWLGRRGAQEPARAAFRECVEALVDVSAAVRNAASHLTQPEWRSLDAAVVPLAASLARVATVGSRATSAPTRPRGDDARSAYRVPQESTDGPARFLHTAAARLESITAALVVGQAESALSALRDLEAEARSAGLAGGAGGKSV
jgi:hypothetical protein